MKEAIEEPIKKSPLLIASLVLLQVLLIVTGVLLVSWYLDNLEQGIEQASLNRVLVSGVAVLILFSLLTVVLVNLLGKHKAAGARRRAVTLKGSTPSRRTTAVKKPVRRVTTGSKTPSKRTTKH